MAQCIHTSFVVLVLFLQCFTCSTPRKQMGLHKNSPHRKFNKHNSSSPLSFIIRIRIILWGFFCCCIKSILDSSSPHCTDINKYLNLRLCTNTKNVVLPQFNKTIRSQNGLSLACHAVSYRNLLSQKISIRE